ncbi:unnamed protein product [Nezara viridula]|uniref:Uncharacterized protein n=1 Tax=Nezara viridula TaxID=85310 RepID=A0A9P0HKV8_NEZVI|nr:unnamed protein product [Nezara viridula]
MLILAYLQDGWNYIANTNSPLDKTGGVCEELSPPATVSSRPPVSMESARTINLTYDDPPRAAVEESPLDVPPHFHGDEPAAGATIDQRGLPLLCLGTGRDFLCTCMQLCGRVHIRPRGFGSR